MQEEGAQSRPLFPDFLEACHALIQGEIKASICQVLWGGGPDSQLPYRLCEAGLPCEIFCEESFTRWVLVC